MGVEIAIGPYSQDCRVVVDGQDITRFVKALSVNPVAGGRTTAQITLLHVAVQKFELARELVTFQVDVPEELREALDALPVTEAAEPSAEVEDGQNGR